MGLYGTIWEIYIGIITNLWEDNILGAYLGYMGKYMGKSEAFVGQSGYLPGYEWESIQVKSN